MGERLIVGNPLVDEAVKLAASALEIHSDKCGPFISQVSLEAAVMDILSLASSRNVPTIHVMFEVEDSSVRVVGTTSASVKRVEQNDDGSYTAVVDHWPD